MKGSILTIKKVDFDYEVKESIVAGLMLEGWMVKAIRAGKVSASDGVYVKIQNGIPVLIGLHVKALVQANSIQSHPEQPTIKLLLTKQQINKLSEAESKSGYTLVMKDLHWDKNLVKCTVCLAKGKKLHDKRSALKEKDIKRESDREIKKYA